MTERSGGQLREGNLCSSPLSVPQLRQEGRVSAGAGGLVSILLRGWDLSDRNIWDQRRSLLVVGLREPEHFFMLRSNIMGCVLPKGGKPSFASALLPKQLHLQLHLQRRGKYMETAAKRASGPAIEKLGNCLKVKGTNGGKMAEWWKQKPQVGSPLSPGLPP